MSFIVELNFYLCPAKWVFFRKHAITQCARFSLLHTGGLLADFNEDLNLGVTKLKKWNVPKLINPTSLIKPQMEAKHDITELNDIIHFVDAFYFKVQQDELIGPIFNDVIKQWEPHLQKMYAFWNAVLFGVPGFTGNPFARHAPLAIDKVHFERWMFLFNETIDELFTGEVAVQARKKAQIMALMFISKLEHMKGNPSRVIV